MTSRRCDFCEIIAGKAPAKIEHEWPDALAIHTNRPKAPGHLLVIPRKHIQDANEDPRLAAKVMERAASIALPPSHIHTNIGAAAAQTVFHLHYHIIPRVANQEVSLSWFKAWDHHPVMDRKPKPPEITNFNFSTEIDLSWKGVSGKFDLVVPSVIKRLFGQ